MPQPDRRFISCLIGVIIGLLLVGLVSGTPLRHAVQVLPACIVLLALSRRASWSLYAAAAILAFWLLTMALIWLFLLGLAHVITGTFTKIEIILTIFIGGWCIVGLLNFFRALSSAKLSTRILVFLGFVILQFAALWLSMKPFLAHR